MADEDALFEPETPAEPQPGDGIDTAQVAETEASTPTEHVEASDGTLVPLEIPATRIDVSPDRPFGLDERHDDFDPATGALTPAALALRKARGIE